MRTSLALFLPFIWAVLNSLSLHAAEPKVTKLWPGEPPGPSAVISGEEMDRSKPNDRSVAGKAVIRLGNVASPEIHVYHPENPQPQRGAVVICPGGGYNILAWDLEGTEVATWLNQIGMTAVVCKYRVPTGSHGEQGRWQGPVSDAQRAISIARQSAGDWKIDPDKIGVLGFSAGGDTAANGLSGRQTTV